jgi:hypothetical protein
MRHRRTDLVLEPTTGTGQLAVYAELRGTTIALNEIADTRADLLGLLFSGTPVTRFNAEQIDDYLPDDMRPTVILMNPPFSAALHVKSAAAGSDLRHVCSALLRLAPGGRLVAITGASTSPLHPAIVRSRGCVWWFATRANLDSDHDSSPSPAPLWTPWGKGFKGVALVSYTTPRDAYLPHAPG